MSLPGLIEIVPLAAPVEAEVAVPGSKSITNRALVLAALARGNVALEGALWSEDTEVMVAALRTLGFALEIEPDPVEPCNRHIRVAGQGGSIPPGGSPEAPRELHVGNAGTAARFLAALVCLGQGTYRLSGVPRMHERPQGALFGALRDLGYRIETPNDRLPALIHGGGARPGRCRVSVASSSQFASGLLLAASVGGWEVEVTGANPDELPYVEMTRHMVAGFPAGGGRFQVEPDASSGSYFWAAGRLAPAGSCVRVANWPGSGWQVDGRFPRFLELPAEVSRDRDLGDSVMTAMILAPFGERSTRFTDLGRLRVQECERVVAMRAELERCGARVEEEGDTLTVFPAAGSLHGATIETYADHRMAMCFATLGLKVPGLKIKNPACVKKTFPNFFEKLTLPPPLGLGAVIREGATGRVLQGAELFAD